MTSSSSPCQTVITPTRISSATIQNVLSTDKNIADAIEAIRSMKHETHEIATTVVLQRILDVNGQLQQFQAKQLEHMIIQHAKRRKLSDEADIQSTVSLDENTEESNKLVEKINGFNRDESALCQESEMKERFMILQNAAKMKRLSQLFRNLESIQGMIIHELQYS